MASSVKKKIVLMAIVLGLMLLGGLWGYIQFRKGNVVQDVTEEQQEEVSTLEQVPSRSTPKRVIGEVIRTETAQCNEYIYIFETVLTEDQGSYFNNIYKGTPSAENFVTSIKAPSLGGNTFYLFTAPRENCDRIYLTVALYETDAPLTGIFEWQTTTGTLRELSVGKNFRTHFAASYPKDWKNAVSPNGENVIIAQVDGPISQENYCDLRTLLLLHLREDREEALIRLPQGEAFAFSGNDGVGGCAGVDLGWIDDSTIYYDIYDARVSRDRPFLERRTLKINQNE